jgi:hypothetical protein
MCDRRPLETCLPEHCHELHSSGALFLLVVASSKEEEREGQKRIGRESPEIIAASPLRIAAALLTLVLSLHRRLQELPAVA